MQSTDRACWRAKYGSDRNCALKLASPSTTVSRVRSMFHRGRPLIRRVSPGLSMELDATWRGGMAVLQRIEDRGFDTLTFRPTLEKRDMAGIAVRSLFSFGRRFLKGEA